MIGLARFAERRPRHVDGVRGPHVVYNMIFLADLGDYQAMNEVYGSYFPENPPARACVQAGLVKPEFLVEIAATAVVDK